MRAYHRSSPILRLAGLAAAVALPFAPLASAAANQAPAAPNNPFGPPAQPTPPQPPAAEVPQPVYGAPGNPAPAMVAPARPAEEAAPPAMEPIPPSADNAFTTDHDAAVGHWGVDARRLTFGDRTPLQDPRCLSDCPVNLNAIGFRRWTSRNYAYNFGLAFALGGGGRRDGGDSETFDTYFGIGPTMGANFLMANWQHLAVSFAPQLDAVFFAPSGSGSKLFYLAARGLFEAELHLGFWGLPQLTVSASTGLTAQARFTTKGSKSPAPIASDWNLGIAAPQSLWDLVTAAQIRYYF